MSGVVICFFFNDTATTEIYTLSLHDALPIFLLRMRGTAKIGNRTAVTVAAMRIRMRSSTRVRPLRLIPGCSHEDRKSTRLNSSHANISYAVFCLKKKINQLYSLQYLHYHSSS